MEEASSGGDNICDSSAENKNSSYGILYARLCDNVDVPPTGQSQTADVSQRHDHGLTHPVGESLASPLDDDRVTQPGESNLTTTKAHNMLTALLQGLELVVRDFNKRYPDKVQVLLSTWEYITNNLKLSTVDDTTSIIEAILRNSLKLVFNGEWPELKNATKTHFNVTLHRCRSTLLMLESRDSASKITTLLRLINNPWGHPVLEHTFHGGKINDDVMSFFDNEELVVIVIRLEMLLDDKCEKEALRLARLCVQYLRKKEITADEKSAPHINYIIDCNIALLWKLKPLQSALNELKDITLEDGAALVRRFTTTHGNASVWSNDRAVAELAAQYFLTVAITIPLTETGYLLAQLMTDWTKLQGRTVSKSMPKMISKLVQQALSAQHIYIFCKILFNQFGDAIRSLCIELCIQGLTSDMNELEQHKAKKNFPLVSVVEHQLSEGFLELSKLVKADIGVYRECILTAFSIDPTRMCYEQLKVVAQSRPDSPQSDPGLHKGEDSRRARGSKVCLLHPPYDPEGGLPQGELCPSCGNFTGIDANPDGKKVRTLGALIKGDTMTKSRNYDVFAAPSIVLDAQSLGLNSQLLRDLTVVLSSNRYLPLSWAFDWSELSVTCENYLANRDSRNKDKELKYLNIDYDQFRSWPSQARDDLYGGIEKGYEYFLFEGSNQEKPPTPVKAAKGSDSSQEPKKRGRPRKVVKADTDTDGDSVLKPKPKRRYVPQLPTILESDTCTQDSKTDSLGSDGCRRNTPKKAAKKVVKPRGAKKKVKETLSATATKAKEVSPTKMVSSFKVDENGEKINTHLTRSTTTNAKVADKFAEPTTIASKLRMVRQHLPSDEVLTLTDNENGQNFNVNGVMVNSLNMSPRVVLQRTDEVGLQTSPKKPLTPNNLQTDAGLASRKGGNTRNQFQVAAKGGTEYEDVSRSMMDCELMKANIPGLNTLELLVPPASEPTVQVVQLPRNPTAPASGSDNAAATHTQPPKATSTSQSAQPASQGECVPSASTWNPPVPHEVAAKHVATGAGQGARPARLPPAAATPEVAPDPEAVRQSRAMTLASLLQSRPDVSRPTTPRLVRVLHAVHASTLLDSSLGNVLADGPPRPVQAVLVEAGGTSGPPTSASDPFDVVASRTGVGERGPQYVLVQNEDRTRTYPDGAEVSSSQAEGLPKFHHAFSNKASRSIYCQTNSSEVVGETPAEEESESTPEVRPSLFRGIPAATTSTLASAAPAKPAQAKTASIINSGMLQSLLNAQPLTRENFMMTSRGPVLRLFRAPARQSPMLYIANSKSHLVANAHPTASSSQPSMKIPRLPDVRTQGRSSSATTSTAPPPPPLPPPAPATATREAADTDDRPLVANKFHAELATSAEPRVCILDSSSDEELERVSRPVLQNALAKTTDSAVAPGGIVLRPQPPAFQPAQGYTGATKDLVNEASKVVVNVDSAVSSLEQQLLEFDVVLKQFTETSKMKEKGEIVPDHSSKPSGASRVSPGGLVVDTDFPVAHIPCLKVPTVTRMLPAGATKTVPKVTKVVMVTGNCQSVTSPGVALSTSSSPPCTSTSSAGKTPPAKSPAKSPKTKSVKTTPATATSSKSSPIPKPQQKPQEDEQTAQRIYAILDDYAEQIRNSPDLNNKPAPRRRSNPPTNPSQTSKRKKSSHSKAKSPGQQSSTAAEMSPGMDDPSMLGSEDSCEDATATSLIPDSPATSHVADETAPLDSSSEGGNLKSVVTEGNDPPEPRHTLFCGVQSMLFKDASQGVGDKPLVHVANSGTMPIYMHGNVRQMLMQGLKAHKVIRVNMPGGASTSGMQATTFVLRHMIPSQQPARVTSQPPTATSDDGQPRVSSPAPSPVDPTVVVPGVRRCLSLGLSSQPPLSFLTDTRFRQAEKSDGGIPSEVAERSATNGGERAAPPSDEPEVPVSSGSGSPPPGATRGHEKRCPPEPLFPPMSPSVSKTSGVSGHLFPQGHDGLMGSIVLTGESHSLPTRAMLQANAKIKPQLLSNNRSSLEKFANTPNQDGKLKADGDESFLKSKFSNRWGEEFLSEEGAELPYRQLEGQEKGTEVHVNVKNVDPSCNNKLEDDANHRKEKMKLIFKSVLAKTKVEKFHEKMDSKSMGQYLAENAEFLDENDGFENNRSELGSAKRKVKRSQTSGGFDDPPKRLRLNLVEHAASTDRPSEVDSSENLTSTFELRHDQTGGQKEMDHSLKSQDRLSHLLAPYRNNADTGLKSTFCGSRSEEVMMVGSEVIATSHLTDSTSEVEETTVAQTTQFSTEDKRESEGKKTCRRSHHEGIRLTEVLLQKSLSEECEDLGVDRPSTSELFPEADLLLDTNSSPCFDANMHEASCSQSVVEPVFEKFSLQSRYSSTSEDGSRTSSRNSDAIGVRIREDGKRAVTKRVRGGEKSDKFVAHKPVTRRAVKNNRGKKPDVNGSVKHSEVDEEDLALVGARESESARNGSSSGVEEDKISTLRSPSSRLISKRAREFRPGEVPKVVADNECSNTDASLGESTFDTESSSDGTSRFVCSPIPEEDATTPSSQMEDRCPSLPLRSAPHKFTFVCHTRSYKKTRPRHLDSDEFHDHNVDSRETWESTSSQDKAGADDEDSGSRTLTETSSEPEPEQSFSFADRVNANGLDRVEGDEESLPAAPRAKKKKKAKVPREKKISVKREPNERCNKRLKKLLNRRRCRTREARCVLLDVLDLTKDDASNKGGHVHHSSRVRRSSLRGKIKRNCMCCNGTVARPAKKDDADKTSATSRKSVPKKQVVKCSVSKKR